MSVVAVRTGDNLFWTIFVRVLLEESFLKFSATVVSTQHCHKLASFLVFLKREQSISVLTWCILSRYPAIRLSTEDTRHPHSANLTESPYVFLCEEEKMEAPRARLLSLGSKLFPNNKQHMRNKNLTKFMQSFSSTLSTAWSFIFLFLF